jgi:hypothetical protein
MELLEMRNYRTVSFSDEIRSTKSGVTYSYGPMGVAASNVDRFVDRRAG